MSHPFMKYFDYGHLGDPVLRERSEPFARLARELAYAPCRDEAERDVALRKLLEAKDAAVRSVL